MRRLSVVVLWLCETLLLGQGIEVNGNFETGDLTGFTLFETPSGHLVSAVEEFDTNNDGVATYSAKLRTGQDGYSSGQQEGGGIFQVVNLPAGDVHLKADIAAFSSSDNSNGGYFKIFFDGQLMDSYDFGSITEDTPVHNYLEFNIAGIEAGAHEIRILVTRTFLTGSVINYIDNIELTVSE